MPADRTPEPIGPDLLVIGGGITGLAAAWEAIRQGRSVTLLEAGSRFGGLIRTSGIDLPDGSTLTIDEAADAFLARVPDAVELCHELGLSARLTQPATTRAMVYTPDGLRWFPADSVLGVPLHVEALEANGLLSDDGLAAVRAEAGRNDEPPGGDISVGELLRSRFGDELVDRLIGPLLGGISAGDVDSMSLRATMPQFADAVKSAGSLSDRLRRGRRAVPEGPVFHGLVGGTQVLVDTLVDRLRASGADLRTDTPVQKLTADDLAERDVVVTTGATPAAQLLTSFSPTAARLLGSIETASVALVTLVFDRSEPAVQRCVDPEASGFLVPRDAGLFMTAASWGSNKWTNWDDGRHFVVRVSAGHRHDRRVEQMNDTEITERVLGDLGVTSGLDASPVATRVSRWPGAFHQYDVGHLELVTRIETAVRVDTDDQIRVAGAAYRGVGIPACIRSGRDSVKPRRR